MTKAEIEAGINAVMAVGNALKELREVPEGTLYAVVMQYISLEQLRKILDMLIRANLVIRTPAHLLRWVGPV